MLTAFATSAATLTPAATRDRKAIKRWSLPHDPRGMALGRNGLVYVGLAATQSLVVINPETGTIVSELVLDSAEIAATKELLTIRPNHDGSVLAIANGSDESVTLVSIPSLQVKREITLEGEAIRDAMFAGAGKYLFILGRTVHVFERDGAREVKRLEIGDPAAMAVDSTGTLLAVAGSEDYGNGKVSVVAIYDTSSLKELSREPLETDKTIRQLLFAAGDKALVALAQDWLGEKSLESKRPKELLQTGSKARIRIDFGDLMSTERICLPPGSGPQIAVLGKLSTQIFFAESRCSANNAFTASTRKTKATSLYAIAAWALAYEPKTGRLYATDPAGFLTIYRAPVPKK